MQQQINIVSLWFYITKKYFQVNFNYSQFKF